MSKGTKHIVGFSGGIDSQTVTRLLLNRYPREDVIALNSDAGGNEDPFTIEHTAWYSKNIHPVYVVRAIYADAWQTEGYAEVRGFQSEDILTFDKMIELKGVPSRNRRFCTEILKLRPQARWIKEHFGPGGRYEGWDYERYTGLRRDESKKRANTPVREFDQYFDCWLNHPIFDWTKQMCFDYVKAHGEEINPLYMMGFDRVGCAPCVMSDKADILNWHIRRPEALAKVAGWEKSLKLPGKTDVGFNWFHGASIEEVVEWAKTSRGGKQYLFPILQEREGCESKYGLCE